MVAQILIVKEIVLDMIYKNTKLIIVLTLFLLHCSSSVEVLDNSEENPYHNSTKPQFTCDTNFICTSQIDCLAAHLPIADSCQEWGCPDFGECVHTCQLGPVLAGQACFDNQARCYGICQTTGGQCLVEKKCK